MQRASGRLGSESGTSRWDQSSSGQQNRAQRRGPKGYKRSDERVKEDICERLMQSGHIDSSEVTIEVTQGLVVIEGTVPDRRMKYAIEDIAEAALGVNDVDNRVRVQGGQSGRQSGSDNRQAGEGGDWSGGSPTTRGGTGTTSSHTSTGNATATTATGASSGQSYGGATTSPSGSASGDAEKTASRGPGSSSGLAGQSTSSSSTANSKKD
jgi:hypothetical protein